MLESLVADSYLVEYGPAVDGGHVFCGPHDIQGAQCPTCQKPLLLLTHLRTTDRIIAERVGRDTPLLVCWTCNFVQAPFFYRVGKGGVELISIKKGGKTKSFPYDNYPMAFPGTQAALRRIPQREQEIIWKLNRGEVSGYDHRDLVKPRHQVGGEPRLVQGELQQLTCPSCKAALRFLASIADDNLDPRGFTGNAFVQILFEMCVTCGVVGGYQATE